MLHRSEPQPGAPCPPGSHRCCGTASVGADWPDSNWPDSRSERNQVTDTAGSWCCPVSRFVLTQTTSLLSGSHEVNFLKHCHRSYKCTFIKWGISHLCVGSQCKALGFLLKLQALLQKHIAENIQQCWAMGGTVTEEENTSMC